MTDNEVMIVIISELIRQSKSKRFIESLQSIIDGLSGKAFIEQTDSPSYRSIILFERNIFPFSIVQYREMAKEIIKKGRYKNGNV